VPIHLQLRSHRLFSENFEEFAHLVDTASCARRAAPAPQQRSAQPDLAAWPASAANPKAWM